MSRSDTISQWLLSIRTWADDEVSLYPTDFIPEEFAKSVSFLRLLMDLCFYVTGS